MSILVIVEHDNASLKSATFHAVAAALQLGADVHVLVAGSAADGAVSAAAALPQVAKVLRADAPYLRAPTAENVAATTLQIVGAGG